MIKKIIFFMVALMSLVQAHGQLATGSWKSFPIFNEQITNIVDTPDNLYYLASGVLYCYDKNEDETYCLSDGYLLNDVDIKNIYYNPAKDYLVIAYQNANIDIIYDRGHIVNLAEIKNAVTNDDKIINDVSFGNDRMYVSANFGLVIYDDSRNEVVQSGFYDRPILGAVEVDGFLFITYGEGPQVLSIPIDGRINSFSNFKRVLGHGWNVTEMRTIDREAHRVVSRADRGIFLFTAEPYKAEERKELTQFAGCSSLITGNDGLYYFVHDNKFYRIDSDGTITAVTAIPDMFAGNIFSTWNGPEKSFWAGDDKGIGNYKLNNGSLTVLSEKRVPDNYTTVSRVAAITPSFDKKGFFISNLSTSHYNPAASESANRVGLYADYYENGVLESVAPVEDVSVKFGSTANWLNNFVGRNTVIAPTFIVNDSENRIYVGSGYEGAYVFKDGKEIAHFYKDNSPLDDPYGCKVYGGTIDKYGNLWLGSTSLKQTGYIMLPFDKLKSPENVKSSDWKVFKFEVQHEGFDYKFVDCEKSDVIFMTSASHKAPLIALQSSTSSSDNPLYNIITNFIDQDGNSFTPIYIQCIVEDHDGRVWLGTSDCGILEITRPADALNSNFTVNRIKVPRNDGSNLADYLMGNESVTGISVDDSNRKWVSTKNSGIYLVSPRGDEILDHFDINNSQLPTNTVNCIYADPNSNLVFVGTNYGLIEYSADSSSARPDYSDVYAYPNPVTPDYTGWITIKGLMDNSLVKICDASMNVIAQIQSEGGMALWDGCNHSGSRVKSGVYYVVASQSDGSSSAGAVAAKILVVN